MYHVTEDTDNFVALHFTGQLEKADYDKMVPYLESKIERHGKINLYWEMDDFEGWDVQFFEQVGPQVALHDVELAE